MREFTYFAFNITLFPPIYTSYFMDQNNEEENPFKCIRSGNT